MHSERNFRILLNGAVTISGPQAVSMGRLGMDGMLWKNIFVSKMYMNMIERHKENDSYRPRNICPGYTGVTDRDRILMLPNGDRAKTPHEMLNIRRIMNIEFVVYLGNKNVDKHKYV